MPILTPEERVGGDLAGKYRLERIVARGGMATIYRGLHTWTERPVAVKILHYEFARNEDIVRRFLQEARATSQLRHPNVVDVLDMGQDDQGTVYLVMELLEGETLRQRLRRGVLTLDEVASSILPLLRGMALAHQRGVVHRDLKPDNLFLAREGKYLVPKVLDFGVAKLADGESSATRTGTVIGTPQYMAPEQVRGERDVGPSADVWSMGVVLFLALSGRLPFEAETPGGVMAKVLVETAPALGSAAPDVPAAVAAVVDRALSRAPAARFEDMGTMLGALEDALTGVVSGPRVVAPSARLDAIDTVLLAGGGPPGAAPPRTPNTAGGVGTPRRLLGWAALAFVALTLVTLALAQLGREEPGATEPTPVAAPSPPSAATEPTTEPTPEPAASPPIEPARSSAAALEPESAAALEPESAAALEPESAAALEPESAAALEPEGELAAEHEPRPSTPELAAGDEDGPTTSTEDEVIGAADDSARPRPAREPRRGTRGALILH